MATHIIMPKFNPRMDMPISVMTTPEIPALTSISDDISAFYEGKSEIPVLGHEMTPDEFIPSQPNLPTGDQVTAYGVDCTGGRYAFDGLRSGIGDTPTKRAPRKTTTYVPFGSPLHSTVVSSTTAPKKKRISKRL